MTDETVEEPKHGGSTPKRYAVGEMSKKARQLAESLTKMGIDAVALLKAGKNPMANTSRFAYFRLACEQLLEDGALNRAKLRASYMATLGWDERTAASHLSIIASFMVANGILAIDGMTYIRVARP